MGFDFDKVVSPGHYNLKNGVEVIDIIRASLSEAEFAGFCKGNVIKYLLRAGKKDNEANDFAKAARYIGYLSADRDELVKKSDILDSEILKEQNAVRDELLNKIESILEIKR